MEASPSDYRSRGLSSLSEQNKTHELRGHWGLGRRLEKPNVQK